MGDNMKEIVIATKNAHKIVEMKSVLEPLGYKVLSLFDFDEFPDIIEDRDTFRGNALKKAQELGDYLQKTVIADDSGLEVDALNGAPGIYSARYAGENVTYKENNTLLLKNMEKVTNRKANFITSMCIYFLDRDPLFIDGYLYGEIAYIYKGENGFGYDPIFIVDQDKRHLAEYTIEEKNKISHRGQCLKQLTKILKELNF